MTLLASVLSDVDDVVAPDVETIALSRDWGDQWLRVSEKVLRGLNHKLTNRVAALDAVVGVMDPAGAPDRELMAALGEEVRRLHQLLLLYRLMPAEASAQLEPVRLQDVVPQVLDLHLHHADLREVPCDAEVDAGTEPILVKRAALFRCLLVMLESGAGSALRSGRGTDARLQLRAGMGTGGVGVCVTLVAPCPPGQRVPTGSGSVVAALRSVLRHAEGEVEGELLQLPSGPSVAWRVILPALGEARRRQRAAAL